MKTLYSRLRRQFIAMSKVRQNLVIGEVVLWTLFLPIGFGISWIVAILLVIVYYTVGINIIQ